MASPRKKIVSIGVKTPYPGFIEPLLAEQVDRVPQGDRWLHGIKYDGYRAQLHIIGESIKVFTRRGYDWTRQFRKKGAKRTSRSFRTVSEAAPRTSS